MSPLRPVFLRPLVALAAGASVAAFAQQPPAPAPPQYSLETYEAFRTRLEGVSGPTQRAERLAEVALVERPGGELQQMVDAALDEEILEAKGALRRIFLTGDETARVEVMELFSRHWRNTLGIGFEPAFVDSVRRGLEDPSPKVRQATIAFTAANHLPRMANFLIDAAEADPSLTLGALLSIEQSRDPIGARWVSGKVGDPDPAIHDAALRACVPMQRQAAFHLRVMADSPVEKVRWAGIEGLLTVASADDRGFLTNWLEKDAAAPRTLRDAVVSALAELEIGTYKPKLPPRPPLTFAPAGPRKPTLPLPS
ncbi:MAG: hypothetical protein MUF27_02610 [Acidobacteria bacterium]|jgi:hypothetical protein|nr:hypothetical protein [Acidobacteriota bacterium]